LIDRARSLKRAGETEKGLAILLELASEGEIDPMIELAFWELDAGRRGESNEWMRRAESALRPDDWDGHVSLHSAYQMGLGEGDIEAQQRRALEHLEKVARAGNVVAQQTLALDFLRGLNGCELNVAEFEKWIQMAIRGGSLDAACVYAEYLCKNDRQLSPELIGELRRGAGGSSRARSLIEAIERSK